MILRIQREMKIFKYVYYTSEESSLKGYAAYTYGFLPKRLKVIKHKNLFELKQTSWLLKLINSLPILNLETFTPFKCYFNSKKIGISKNIIFRPMFIFDIEKDKYEIRQHNGNYISLMKNDEQIALYKKEVFTKGEKNKYIVEYIKEIDTALILLFCIFIDNVFFQNHLSISYLKCERDFVINDEFKERIRWRP